MRRRRDDDAAERVFEDRRAIGRAAAGFHVGEVEGHDVDAALGERRAHSCTMNGCDCPAPAPCASTNRHADVVSPCLPDRAGQPAYQALSPST